MMTTTETLLRLACGFGLGSVIGFERQYRARMAGLRTNALVAVGAALFVLLSAHGFHGGSAYPADPTRVAAQIVSGIGFLGGGVILREGLTVRGLNTAATLWCSAAVGALAGAGLYLIAAAGTVVIVATHLLLRPIGHAVDRRPEPRREIPARYIFRAVTDEEAQAHIRTLVVQALATTDFALCSMESETIGEDGGVEVRASAMAEQRDDKQLESAVSLLSFEPSVTSVRWQVESAGENDEG